MWNEDGFKMLDDVIDWCEKYRIYAILDLHAAREASRLQPATADWTIIRICIWMMKAGIGPWPFGSVLRNAMPTAGLSAAMTFSMNR